MESAISGLRVADMRMAVSAHNVANMMTPGYRAYAVAQQDVPDYRGVMARVVQTDNGTDLGSEMVAQRLNLGYMKANGQVLKTSNQMTGELLDLWA